MAIKKEVNCSCPECKRVFMSKGYEIVNGSVDEHLRQAVVTGSIFDFTCPNCNHIFRQLYAIAYQDMEKQVMIFLDLGDHDWSEKIAETKALFPDYSFRVVRDMMAYIEKIHIFSAGLNDKVITYLEAYIKKSMVDRKAETGIEPSQVLFDSLHGSKGLISFGVLNPQKKRVMIDTPIRDYQHLLNQSAIKERFSEKDDEYYIDEGWVKRLEMG